MPGYSLRPIAYPKHGYSSVRIRRRMTAKNFGIGGNGKRPSDRMSADWRPSQGWMKPEWFEWFVKCFFPSGGSA
jgi:hypothetical protein